MNKDFPFLIYFNSIDNEFVTNVLYVIELDFILNSNLLSDKF